MSDEQLTAPGIDVDEAPALDPTAAAEAPKKRGRRAPRAARAATSTSTDSSPKRGPGRPSNTERLERQLCDQLGAIALTVAVLHPQDGMTLARRAPELAAAFAKLAEQNPRIRKMLEGSLTGSAWLQLTFALGGLGLELAQNHRAIPAPPSGEAPAPAGGFDLSAWANLAGSANGNGAAA
jgi:hypothetical protein